MRQELVVAVWDDHAVIPENHADQYRRRNFQILEGNIDQGRMAAHLRFKQAHLAVGEIFYVQRRRRHDDAVDFLGRNQLRVQHQIDIEIFF